MFVDHPVLDLFYRSAILAPLGLLWITLLVRGSGLRTFSKMTAFDFVATVAVGSLLATAINATEWPGFLQSTLGILFLLLAQRFLATLREDSPEAREAIDNSPRLLFSEGTFHRDTMTDCKVPESDLWAKMREANVLKLDEVHAIVLESTGDVSVIHGSSDDFEERLLTGVE